MSFVFLGCIFYSSASLIFYETRMRESQSIHVFIYSPLFRSYQNIRPPRTYVCSHMYEHSDMCSIDDCLWESGTFCVLYMYVCTYVCVCMIRTFSFSKLSLCLSLNFIPNFILASRATTVKFLAVVTMKSKKEYRYQLSIVYKWLNIFYQYHIYLYIYLCFNTCTYTYILCMCLYEFVDVRWQH